MERLGNAKKFFISHREIKSSGSAIINIDSLLKKAISTCLSELSNLLIACGDAIEYNEGIYQGFNLFYCLFICIYKQSMNIYVNLY